MAPACSRRCPNAAANGAARRAGAAWLAENGLARTPPPPLAEQVATQLAGFDAALAAFGARSNRRVEHPVGLDAGLLVRRRRQGARRADRESRRAGASVPAALRRPRRRARALARSDGAMLETLAWRGSESRLALAQLARAAGDADPGAPGDAAQPVERRRRLHLLRRRRRGRAAGPPFSPRRAARSGASARCPSVARADAAASAPAPCAATRRRSTRRRRPADRARRRAGPRRSARRQPLERAAVAAGDAAAARDAAPADRRALSPADRQRRPRPSDATTRAAPNRVVLDGSGVDVGFSIDLTIDPALQALAQKTAACYTGRQAACRALGLQRQADKQALGEPLLEGAMVRMAAIAVIDVASGRIEALAGALSPCARQEVDGPGRDASCDRACRIRSSFGPTRCSTRGLPRRDAGLDGQADHGRGVPLRPRRRRALARRRAGGDEARRDAGAREPARPADALGFGALPRPHVLQREELRRLPPAVAGAGDGVGVRLERRAAPMRGATAASATCSRARRSTPRARWPRPTR
jgi:hypothetical protein